MKSTKFKTMLSIKMISSRISASKMASLYLPLILMLLLASDALQAAVLVQQPVATRESSGPTDTQISQASQPTSSHQSVGVSSETTQQSAPSQNDGGAAQHQGGPGAASVMGSISTSASLQQAQHQMGLASSGATGSASSAVSMGSSSQALTLPKINIYASRSEVKKLLGIDTSISYITNGQLNTYPLGFSIPMGYHLSDMIFTWQNLGPTNVNYSISLVIGNIQAVERPLINITRSGLIPRHEQVFKITLPCSGKITDEVDVQVLINIMGLVPAASNPQLGDAGDNIYGSAVVDDGDTTSGGAAGEAQQPSAADYLLARAVQQQNELLAAAQASASQQGQSNSSSDQMQADQMQLGDAVAAKRTAGPPQPAMRMVSHTLAIKRKKICTQHPVPVQPMPRQPEIRPPNQPPPPTTWAIANELSPPPPLNKLPPATPDQQQSPSTPSTSGGGYSSSPGQESQPSTPLAEPSHQPTWTMPESPTGASIAAGGFAAPQGSPLFTSQSQSQKLPNSASIRQQAHYKQQPHHYNHQQTPQIDSRSPATHETGGQRPEQAKTPNWTPPTLQQLTSSATTTTTTTTTTNQPQQLDETNPLLDLLQRSNASQQQAGNPLLLTLIVMSLIISVALIALLVLGSVSTSTPSYSRSSPLDKLAALTNCIWRRTSAGSRAVNKCTKNVAPITIKNGIIGTFNGRGGAALATSRGPSSQHDSSGPKSNFSSISGLSTISGLNNKQFQHHQTLNPLTSPYCQKQQQHASYNTGYYHHYQHPPDLLLGGPATTAPNATSGMHQSLLTSPYQITMSNNRMTKLFLANPTSSGTYSVDNNYMPITTNTSASSVSNGCQASHSDNGSVYQTIY